MNRKQYFKYLLRVDLMIKKSKSYSEKKTLRLLRANVVKDFESRGRVICRPIKGRLVERSPKALIKACDYSQGKTDSPLSSRVFDYVKAKR